MLLNVPIKTGHILDDKILLNVPLVLQNHFFISEGVARVGLLYTEFQQYGFFLYNLIIDRKKNQIFAG